MSGKVTRMRIGIVAHAQRVPSVRWMTIERPSTDMLPESGSVESDTKPRPVLTNRSLAPIKDGALSLPHLPERSPYS